MNTSIVSINENQIDMEAIKEAGKIIQNGGLVAFPTETVYGLGGDGLNPESSRKIYAAKGRPSDNPMIVHIAEIDELAKITKKDLVNFANEIFKSNNYVQINKLQGQPESIVKVAKPAITPIEVGRDNESAFLKEIKARQVKPIEPKFFDPKNDVTKG